MAQNNINTTEYTVRPPIVTIMGHVDHGKTSILDFIRKTNIQAREYGGITQHIGAYQITHNSSKITFIDTPGHAAFTNMRARGGKAADIVILVVAAEEGVMPQTREAISHAKAAGVPIIVAINKIDKPGADPQKVKQQLAQENILVEDWGGDIVVVETSATTGQGITDLLDAILAVAELSNFTADPNEELEAIIIESKKDPKRGVTVSCIVRNGTLKVGDNVSASGQDTKIRQMNNDKGQQIQKALPGDPVEVLGFKETPNVGDLIIEQGSELAELAVDTERREIIGAETKRTVGVIIKADTQGTLEAVKGSLANLITETVGIDFSIKFIHTATGDISESDIMLASTTKSVVVGFNVKIARSVEDLASELRVPTKTYKTIYDLIDDVQDLLEGTAFEAEKKIKGRAEILKTFKLPSGDVVLGCSVIAGRLKVNDRIAIYDKNPNDLTELDQPLFRTSIKKLKTEKDEVNEVGKGHECGVLLKPQYEEAAKGLFFEVQ